MKTLSKKARQLLAEAREIIFPTLAEREPAAIAAETAARELWSARFSAFDLLLADADILEIGYGDARLLGHLRRRGELGRPRSAAGVGRGAAGSVSPESILDELTPDEAIELHEDISYLSALDPLSFDLVICRDFESMFVLDGVEDGLKRLYGLLRPGGDAVIHVGCADPRQPRLEAPGYGFLTPTAWSMLLLRAGFEIVRSRRTLRAPSQTAKARDALPMASSEERMTEAMTFHLVRPWEHWELAKIL